MFETGVIYILIFTAFYVQYINRTGFRVCVKELYEAKYDPLFISYTVLSGKSFNGKQRRFFYGRGSNIVSYL